MASIKFDHVWKRFGEVSVLKDLDIARHSLDLLAEAAKRSRGCPWASLLEPRGPR